MAKKKLAKKVKRPLRPPDHHSKRGVPYWWAPEWVRDVNGTIGRIKPILPSPKAMPELHMLSRDGNLTYIRGSIQKEFIRWHEERQIDVILFGIDPNEVLETDWEYE